MPEYSDINIAFEFEASQNIGSESARLEALEILSEKILKEVESLRMAKKFTRARKIDLVEEVQNYEASLIRKALSLCGSNQRQAAKLLCVKISTLHSKIKRLGIEITGEI